MRVLIVSQYFWPENFRINDLVKELVLRGHELTVLTGMPNYPDGKVFDAFKEDRSSFDNYAGAKIYRAPMFSRGVNRSRLLLNYLSFVFGASFFGTWFLRGQDFDVIFAYEPSPATVGLPAILLGGLKRVPVVFWALDLWPDSIAAVGEISSTKVLALVGHMVRFIYNRCALVLGQSRGFLGSLAKYCDDVNKIRYFPSWAEDLFCVDNISPADEVPILDGVFNVLFAGNIGEAQDFPAILEAAEILKDNSAIRWLIVGDGRMAEWVHKEVIKRDLTHCFLLLGRFDVERMPSFYAHADAFLVALKHSPVFSLTVPGKVQSYLMAGVPLLGMLDGEGSSVILDANAGLVCPSGDSKGLAEAVLKLSLMKKSDRQQLGNNGRTYAQKEFNRDLLISKLESWFLEINKSSSICK